MELEDFVLVQQADGALELGVQVLLAAEPEHRVRPAVAVPGGRCRWARSLSWLLVYGPAEVR